MPVPGPRTQVRPLPGYTNPGREMPDRINLWDRPGAVSEAGRSPGTMFVNLRGNVLGAGTVRRFWRQTVNYAAAQAGYSWTHSAPGAGGSVPFPDGFFITRALRYMTRSVYEAAGVDNTRFAGAHTTIHPRARSKPVSLNAGNVRNRPTVRNRLVSFGSRVPTINQKVDASQ